MEISKLVPKTDPWFNQMDFIPFIETHLEYLKKLSGTTMEDVSSNIGNIYKGDFYGLLSHIKIPVDHHYITMRMNGFLSSADYDGSTITVIIPSINEIGLLKNIFRTKYKT